MSATVRERVVHEHNNACVNHCFSCDLDHLGEAWLWCFECGHAYRSEAELIRAYRDGARDALGFWRWIVLRVLPLQADRIRFCPLCMHDFCWGPS